jgi:F-type H+-transporting ATPase subunit alpha
MASETLLRPGEIKDILLREIEAADLHELDVEEVGTVLEVKDGIARIYGLQKAMAGEMLEITSSETGNAITSLALNLEEDNIGAVVLGLPALKDGDGSAPSRVLGSRSAPPGRTSGRPARPSTGWARSIPPCLAASNHRHRHHRQAAREGASQTASRRSTR